LILPITVAPIRELTDKAALDASTANKIVKAARREINTDFITAKQPHEESWNEHR